MRRVSDKAAAVICLVWPVFLNGASGDIGGGAAETGVLSADSSANGGNGGFGAGGGACYYNGGLTSSGNGGFGGGGAGGLNACNYFPCPAQVAAGTGGYGAGAGHAPNSASVGVGGSGAGFGGAIFEYSGQLVLSNVLFANNAAVGGTVVGLSGEPTLTGQREGGGLFIYGGAVAINSQALGATFGTGSTANVAAAAGLPGNGNSAAPYTNGATCPGQDP